MKDWEQIRRAYYVEEKSLREIARETGYARRTISRMIDAEAPPTYQRRSPKKVHKLGPYKQQIQQLLAQNASLPRKQRWTAPMIYKEIQKAEFAGADVFSIDPGAEAPVARCRGAAGLRRGV